MNLDIDQEQKENIYSVNGLRLRSHGGQFASGPGQLKDRPKAGRGAARRGAAKSASLTCPGPEARIIHEV